MFSYIMLHFNTHRRMNSMMKGSMIQAAKQFLWQSKSSSSMHMPTCSRRTDQTK